MAAGSTVSSHKPAKNTRHFRHRRPIIPSQPKKPDDLPVSEQYILLARIPINVHERPDDVIENGNEERGTSRGSETRSVHTPAPSLKIALD